MGTDIQLTEKQEQVVTTVAIGAVLAFMFPPIGLAISAVYGGVVYPVCKMREQECSSICKAFHGASK
ncbi:hypothetical protein F8M41_006896 [Gigaspora margarita]|uniref:Uncharacterized protein n=1 Tax=Gigaspora margarita TaxID=4874 RepID=A0A8H3X5N0_GIGMA|nr:hypothetical protein F8M41_006896 [Gigaspora margarita]